MPQNSSKNNTSDKLFQSDWIMLIHAHLYILNCLKNMKIQLMILLMANILSIIQFCGIFITCKQVGYKYLNTEKEILAIKISENTCTMQGYYYQNFKQPDKPRPVFLPLL